MNALAVLCDGNEESRPRLSIKKMVILGIF